MTGFLGEFSCAIDNKNRLRVPAGLLKQLLPADMGRFVVNRGFEKCLVLYPISEWDRVFARINKLNTFKKENREFKRSFLRGATELALDTAERVLIPRQLMEYADIENEVILAANGSIIEIWNPKVYDAMLSEDSDKYSDLAERVMGNEEIDEL
jgi:MraZ protein